MRLVAPKILRGIKGESVAQEIHWDNMNGFHMNQRISVIMYLTATKSTAMPRFVTRELFRGVKHTQRPSATAKKTQEEVDQEWEEDKQYLKATQHIWGNREDYYHSVDVEPGDIMIFRESTPHFGVAVGATATSVRLVYLTIHTLRQRRSR